MKQNPVVKVTGLALIAALFLPPTTAYAKSETNAAKTGTTASVPAFNTQELRTVPNNSIKVEPRKAAVYKVSKPTRGKHKQVVKKAARIPDNIRPWAECVAKRESGASLKNRQSREDAQNRSSSAQGRWQFLDNSWRRGLSFHVRDRLIKFGMPKADAKKTQQHLASRPIKEWDGWLQDIGFVETVKRGGAFHWNGHGCKNH